MLQPIQQDLLKTKQHFEILDGLRGIAAIAIVVFHFMECVYTPDLNFIGHGFLAVDFFFCLSGFVIGYAYDDRIAGMGTMEFFKSRLIRLQPLVVFGAVLGLLAFLFDPFSSDAANYTFSRTALIFLASVFMIPYPVMEERFFNLFGINAPSWSLFWEYIANMVYALVLCRLGRRILVPLAIIAAGAIIYIAYDAGSLLGGWDGSTFWHGGARIAYSFLAGLLIYRYQLIIKNKLGFIGLSILLLLAFVMPFSWAPAGQAVVILLYFPLLVSLGAGAMVSPGLKGLCNFSGNLSYPLYMTHYAAMFIFAHYYGKYTPGTQQLTLIIIFGTIFLIGFAYLIMRYYDIPVRNYLTVRRKRKIAQKS